MEPGDSSLSLLRHGREGQGSCLAADDHTARLTTYTIVFGERVTVTVDAHRHIDGLWEGPAHHHVGVGEGDLDREGAHGQPLDRRRRTRRDPLRPRNDKEDGACARLRTVSEVDGDARRRPRRNRRSGSRRSLLRPRGWVPAW